MRQFFFVHSNHIRYSTVGTVNILVEKIDDLVLTMHKTLVIDWLSYVQNILKPSIVGSYIVGPP